MQINDFIVISFSIHKHIYTHKIMEDPTSSNESTWESSIKNWIKWRTSINYIYFAAWNSNEFVRCRQKARFFLLLLNDSSSILACFIYIIFHITHMHNQFLLLQLYLHENLSFFPWFTILEHKKTFMIAVFLGTIKKVKT